MLDHLDDLDADFRVFYRIDDIEQLDSIRFFRLAYRVTAYEGVMALLMRDEQERERVALGLAPGEQVQRVGSSGAELAVSFDDEIEYAAVEVG